jgi:hypothetical protein
LDLYDRVGYLDMVKAHQQERKRKFRSMANLTEAGTTATATIGGGGGPTM